MKFRRISPSLVITFGFLFVLTACSQTVSVPPASPARVHPTATILVTTAPPPSIGAIPSDCVSGPTLRPIFSGLGPGIGKVPLFVFGFDSPHPVLRIDPAHDPYQAPYGWIWKIIWEVGPHFASTITLRGNNVRTKAPIRFHLLDEPIASSALLDPQHPNHPVPSGGDGYAEWGSSLFVPAAGCYQKAGFSQVTSFFAIKTLFDYTLGSTFEEQADPQRVEARLAAIQQIHDVQPLPVLMKTLEELGDEEREDSFEAGLSFIIIGLRTAHTISHPSSFP